MTKRWATLLGCVLIAGALVWSVVQVTMLEGAERTDASGYGQFVLAAVGLLIVVAGPLWKAGGAVPAPPLDERADLLATAMREQWEKSAAERRLLRSSLTVQWEVRDSMSPPLDAATKRRGRHYVLDPLPGLSGMPASGLKKGDLRGLHAVYGGVASGRIQIVGAPGAGKSATAILLLLDALKSRSQADDQQRRDIPVPVIFTLHGWDPATTTVEDWITGKLTEIPLLRGRGGARVARSLLVEKRIAVFLDGLDEIPENVRPEALRALSDQTDFRVVLLSRSVELEDAAGRSALVGAATLELQPVAREKAWAYLREQLVDPAPVAWRTVLDAIVEDPDCPLAQALTSPLAITLLRDAYPANAEPDELLDISRFPTAEAIERHLLDHSLVVAYSPKPGQPRPRYSLKHAERVLGYVAHKLNGSRDLAWWITPRWISLSERVITAVLVIFILITVPGFLVSALRGTNGEFLRYLGASAVGLALGTLRFGLMGAAKPKRVLFLLSRTPATRRRLWLGFVIGALIGNGFLMGFWGLLGDGTVELLVKLVLVGGTWFGLAGLVIARLTQSNVSDTSSADPRRMWFQDLTSGLTFGLVLSFAVLAPAWAEGVIGGTETIIFGAILAFAIGISLTVTWAAFLAQMYLWSDGRIPIRFVRFLEDARKRGVLRVVGPVYQFRHATLQDRLVEKYAGS